MSTIAVTGGAGFIGSHLSEALLLQGDKVVNIDSFNDYYNPFIKRNNVAQTQLLVEKMKLPKDDYRIEEGDIQDKDFLTRVFEENQVDCIVHLAAYAGVRPSIENPTLYADVNLNGTVNLLEICKQFQVRRFIFASSSSVYGNNVKVPFSERDAVDHPISPYAATKKAGELLCHTYHSLYDMSVACLRFFTVYGPRQRPDLAIHKFTSLISNDRSIPFYGDGTSERDYTYIEDIVDGIIKSIEWTGRGEKKYEVFNLGESKTISLSRMVEEIERALGKKAVLKRMHEQPGDVKRTYADISKAKRELGYDPKWQFTDGIHKFVEWYQSQIG